MVCTPVCARVLFLATFVAKCRLRQFEFRGGHQRPDTAAPERGLWGWLQLRENFASGRESARRPVLENEFGQEFAGAIFVSVFDSLWFLFVFFFVLFLCVWLAALVFFLCFCSAIFCDCVSLVLGFFLCCSLCFFVGMFVLSCVCGCFQYVFLIFCCRNHVWQFVLFLCFLRCYFS